MNLYGVAFAATSTVMNYSPFSEWMPRMVLSKDQRQKGRDLKELFLREKEHEKCTRTCRRVYIRCDFCVVKVIT